MPENLSLHRLARSKSQFIALCFFSRYHRRLLAVYAGRSGDDPIFGASCPRIRANLSLVGSSDSSPCQLSSILRGDEGMAHVTLSDVVSNGQVDVDGGYIAERQRGHTHGMNANHCFQLVLVSADEDCEREAKCVETACKMFGAMWTADAEEVELCDESMTILCDMLAAWKLLEVLSSMDLTLHDEEVWTELADIPLRAKMSSKTTDVLVAIHVEDSSSCKTRWEALTNARKPMQRYAASSAEDKVSKQSLETDGGDENMVRLMGLLRHLCVYDAQMPLVLVQDYTDEVLRKSTAMLVAGLEALKECICNVQPLQELAHEATLNFSLDETMSAMMMHIGDAIQSMDKTVLQDKAAALLGTLLLASDVTWPSDGTPAVAEALEELSAFDRHLPGFRLVEEHEELFQNAYENLETRVAAEFESYIHGASPLPLRTFVSFSCWVQEPLTQNVQITQMEGASTQVEILG